MSRIPAALRALVVAVTALTVMCLVGGCSSSGSGGSGSSPAPASGSGSAACKDYTALKQSLSKLTDIDVQAEGVAGVKAALTDVKTNLRALKSSAGAHLQPQIDALQSAVGAMSDTVDNPPSGTAATVKALVSDAAAVGQAATQLGTAAKGVCGTS